VRHLGGAVKLENIGRYRIVRAHRASPTGRPNGARPRDRAL
jgi:hypothetical protein